MKQDGDCNYIDRYCFLFVSKCACAWFTYVCTRSNYDVCRNIVAMICILYTQVFLVLCVYIWIGGFKLFQKHPRHHRTNCNHRRYPEIAYGSFLVEEISTARRTCRCTVTNSKGIAIENNDQVGCYFLSVGVQVKKQAIFNADFQGSNQVVFN